jgi:hypothetical protein
MTSKIIDPRWSDLFEMISDIADESHLRMRWASLVPNVAASPQEDIALIYDTIGIEKSLSLPREELGLSDSQHQALSEVQERLDVFLDGIPNERWDQLGYREVLANPDWQKVIVAARRFVDSLAASR